MKMFFLFIIMGLLFYGCTEQPTIVSPTPQPIHATATPMQSTPTPEISTTPSALPSPTEKPDLCKNINCNANSKCENGICKLLTCAEQEGNICGEKYFCSTDFVESKDSGVCCPITCQNECMKYMIPEQLGPTGYQFIKVEESVSENPFSGQLIRGCKAIYAGEGGLNEETIEVSLWMYSNGNSFNKQLEELIYGTYLGPTQSYDASLYESSNVIGISEKYGNRGMSFIWPSGNNIIQISRSNTFLVEKAYYTKYPSTFKPEKMCIDSDGGTNYNEGGYVKYLVDGPNGQYAIFQDTCQNIPNTIGRMLEGICENGKFRAIEYTCPEMCSSSAAPYYGRCAGLPNPPMVAIKSPAEGGSLSVSGGLIVRAETDVSGNCQLKLTDLNSSTVLLNWEAMSSPPSGTLSPYYEKEILAYLQPGTRYSVEVKCSNTAGTGNTAQVSFALISKY
jgi:hypothetical protein